MKKYVQEDENVAWSVKYDLRNNFLIFFCFSNNLQKIYIPRMKYRHMPIRARRTIIQKIIQIHAQHGQSAFNPRARIRLNDPDIGSLDTLVYSTGPDSGAT